MPRPVSDGLVEVVGAGEVELLFLEIAIRVARRDPDPDADWNRDHRITQSAAVTRTAGASALIVTRAPRSSAHWQDVL